MNSQPQHFAPLARLLHWLMALMIIAMLFIGAGMVASVSERHEWLIHLHKPLGVAILLLVILRLAVRFSTRQPPLPADLPGWQALAAKASHVLLYALMLVLPLLGWAMISASGEPVMLGSALQLPSIVPADARVFAFLRKAHGYLAYLLFLTVLLHLAAALGREDALKQLVAAKTQLVQMPKAVLDAVASRVCAMVRRVGIEGNVVLIGGMGHNPGFVQSLKSAMDVDQVLLPEMPEFVSASNFMFDIEMNRSICVMPSQCSTSGINCWKRASCTPATHSVRSK